MKALACVVGISLVLVLVPACKGGPLKIVASCDMRKEGVADTNSQLCMDLTDRNLDKVKQLCDAQGNKWSEKPCDRKTSLGGCRDDSSITWTYPSPKDKTVEDAKKACFGEAKYVGADWTEPAK